MKRNQRLSKLATGAVHRHPQTTGVSTAPEPETAIAVSDWADVAGRSREAGDTLIEILVTVAILGIAIAGLIGALGDNAIATAGNRNEAQVQSVLVSGAEYVKSMTWSGPACSAAGTIPANSLIVPHSTSISVSYGQGASADGLPACVDLEQVLVTVSGYGYNVSMTVVKRDQE